MLKFWKKIMAVFAVFVISLFVGGISITGAASLTEGSKATIIAVNMETKAITDLSDKKTFSQALEWTEANAPGQNLCFVSVDKELLESWKQVILDAGYTAKNVRTGEEVYKKISQKAKHMLKEGTKYSFEVKNAKSGKSGWNMDDITDSIRDIKGIFR